MSNNIREKLSLIIEDIQRLEKYEQLKLLEDFVTNEVGFLSTRHNLSKSDLQTISETALRTMQDLDLDTIRTLDGQLQRTLCYVEGVIVFLRKEGLIKFDLNYKKK